MQIRTYLAPFLLGTLLAVTACEKIDDGDLNASGSQTAASDGQTSSGGDAGNDNGGSSGIAVKTLEVQSDGTLLFPSENHVRLLDATDEAPAIYVSLYEWHDILGSDVEKAGEYAEKYSEGGLRGWRIPTKEESKAIKARYYSSNDGTKDNLNEALTSLNSEIESYGGMGLRAWQMKDNHPAYRYFCEEGTYSFSLKQGSNTTKVGAKQKYNLRLVCDENR